MSSQQGGLEENEQELTFKIYDENFRELDDQQRL